MFVFILGNDFYLPINAVDTVSSISVEPNTYQVTTSNLTSASFVSNTITGQGLKFNSSLEQSLLIQSDGVNNNCFVDLDYCQNGITIAMWLSASNSLGKLIFPPK